nr:hypothetical protein [Pedobacter sp. D749]
MPIKNPPAINKTNSRDAFQNTKAVPVTAATAKRYATSAEAN